jgi:hypothetical protein
MDLRRQYFTSCLNQFCRSFITPWRLIRFQLYNRNFKFKEARITEKTNYRLLSRHQNVGLSYDVKIAKHCSENVAKFRYLGTTIANQNLIQEGIKRRLNSGNACYHSVKNLLSSRLLSKNIKIGIYKSIFLSVLYGCQPWYLILREEHRLRVFVNRVLR